MLNNYFFVVVLFKDVFPDKATERKILSFAIECPIEGCDWTGELRNKEVIRIIAKHME